jgi:hypothetical protein
MAQEGDDGPMMLMLEVCELKDKEELAPPTPAKEIVKLVEEKVYLHDKQRMKTGVNVWYLDTGASNHMTGDKAQFSELNLSVGGTVRFGDGSTVGIAGRGNVLLELQNSGQRVLTNVYYIPELKRNIISLGKLTERGCKIVLEDKYLWGYDRQRQLMMKVQRSKNSLYILDLDQADPICDGSLVEKQRSAPLPRESTLQASKFPEVVHGDICGPVSPITPSGNKYFMLVVDDYSQYMWIVLLKSKDQALQAFMKIKEAGEEDAEAKLKALRIVQGGEYQTVVAMARSMMESKGLPGKFWGEAVNTAVYLLNRAPTESGVGMTPYEAWYGRKPSVDHLHTFGCVAHVKTVSGHKSKLAERSTPLIMTGYEGSKLYRLCNPYTNKVVVTGDVVFDEEKSWNWGSNKPVHQVFHFTYSSCEHADNSDQPDSVNPRPGAGIVSGGTSTACPEDVQAESNQGAWAASCSLAADGPAFSDPANKGGGR